MSKIRRLLGIYIRKNNVTPKERKQFKYFGENSVIPRPSVPIGNKHLITIGDNVTFYDGIRMQAYTDKVDTNPEIKIGNGTYIGYNVSILACADITIGESCMIASNSLITSHNHGIDASLDEYYVDQPVTASPITIGNGVWVGEQCLVLEGVHIGDKAVIGANSVVTKDIPAYCMAVGSPAKVIKKFNFETKSWERV